MREDERSLEGVREKLLNGQEASKELKPKLLYSFYSKQSKPKRRLSHIKRGLEDVC